MNPERWQELDQLFHSALEREPGERAGWAYISWIYLCRKETIP